MIVRRISLLLAVALIATAVAPVASADHCERCRFAPTLGFYVCTPAWDPVIGGRPLCEYDESVCVLTGPPCEPHDDNLAFEFTIAAVERLDEPVRVAEMRKENR